MFFTNESIYLFIPEETGIPRHVIVGAGYDMISCEDHERLNKALGYFRICSGRFGFSLHLIGFITSEVAVIKCSFLNQANRYRMWMTAK